MVDAETASDFKTGTTLSIIAKAEAFYNMGTKLFNFVNLFSVCISNSGQFEMALVHFYRAMRLRKDTEIENGMFKCRNAILNVVGGEDGLETDLGTASSLWHRKINYKL